MIIPAFDSLKSLNLPNEWYFVQPSLEYMSPLKARDRVFLFWEKSSSLRGFNITLVKSIFLFKELSPK